MDSCPPQGLIPAGGSETILTYPSLMDVLWNDIGPFRTAHNVMIAHIFHHWRAGTFPLGLRVITVHN